MRGGRFGSKAGRVAVVVALVLGTLAAGTVAANADELASTDDTAATTIGAVTGQSITEIASTLSNDWG
jgi:hypothetical protein